VVIYACSGLVYGELDEDGRSVYVYILEKNGMEIKATTTAVRAGMIDKDVIRIEVRGYEGISL